MSERTGWIYWLLFPNGKGYVGQTVKTVGHRFAAHRSRFRLKGEVRNSRMALYAAWRKHGEPQCIPLFECPTDALDASERATISVFGSLSPGGYNMTAGGDDNPALRPEVKEKISRVKKFAGISPANRAAINAARAAMTPEQRSEWARKGAASRGAKWVESVKRGKARQTSERKAEINARISATLKAKVASGEVRVPRNHFTPEVRERMRQSQLANARARRASASS